MSAASIPNLNSLRRGGARGRGRGRDAPGQAGGSVGAPLSTSKDAIIQQTDQDAATSRLSAVQAGYLEDAFVRHLTASQEVPRRLPLMNRGAFARTAGIDRVVTTFVESVSPGKAQIISLGAGSDTRCFRLRQKQPAADILYHEIDFAVNTRTKIARLRSPPLAHVIKQLCNIDTMAADCQVSADLSELQSPTYCIHARDLRRLPGSGVPLPAVDPGRPTLLISECCLVYLAPGDADAVLEYFSKLFERQAPLAVVIYEPIRPDDAFGRTMVSNLTARGIHLQTLEKYAGLAEQRQRLQKYGFDPCRSGKGTSSGCGVADVHFIWRRWLHQDEKERIEALEWMDEVEEFVLLAQHYCIAWGWHAFPKDGIASGGFDQLPTQIDGP